MIITRKNGRINISFTERDFMNFYNEIRYLTMAIGSSDKLETYMEKLSKLTNDDGNLICSH